AADQGFPRPAEAAPRGRPDGEGIGMGRRAIAGVLLLWGLGSAAALSAQETEATGFAVDWGFEAKAHFRDSEASRNPSPFPFPPEFLPPGQQGAFQETVDPDQHFEVSTLTLLLGAPWGETVVAHAKIDFIDLYDRNPTSSDREIDVDEVWLRFGRDPDRPAERLGAYAKVGKFAHFERQNDRHLESYGLIST